MKRSLGVFNSDQVNLSGFRFPASELVKAEERHQMERLGTGLPTGLPVNIQHDMHRPIGWSQVLGHFVDGAMVRVVGLINEAETVDEKSRLAALVSSFWDRHHDKGMDVFKKELVDRIKPAVLGEDAKFLHIESYVVSRPNLAAELYPELFGETSDLVDKDGLTDYRALSMRLKQLQPGVFHDPARDLLLFAHRFFRRSLSHRNKLNDYFLSSFDKTATERSAVTPRLRLDPDLIGHPATNHSLVELEYWRGPRFTDDISSIPSGVAEHKASERTMYYDGIDKTQVWWKAPETRRNGDAQVEYRTLEVEELIENSSGGLPGECFGCRYAHAEFSSDVSAITHFDGAIRAYEGEAYLERIEASIDRAGKRSQYTKLFRFDGPLPVESWKRVLSDYFRGNPLVPEYLGAPSEEGKVITTGNPEQIPAPATGAEAAVTTTELCAFISLTPGDLRDEISVEFGTASWKDDSRMRTIETGCEAVDQYLRQRIDLSAITSLGSTDGTLDLSTVSFGPSSRFPASMHEAVAELSKALLQDIEQVKVQKVALALRWQHDKLLTTLSFRGTSNLVAQVLERLFSIVDATKAASEWIEPLSEYIKGVAPSSLASEDLTGVVRGRLTLERADESQYRMVLPDSLMQELLSNGTL